MKGNSVACMATDGREDFEQGFIMNEGQLHKWARKGEGWMLGEGVGNLQWMNEVGIGLIEKEEYLGCTSS